MRDPNRIPRMLALVEQIWTKYPDFRLGQLVDNAKEIGSGSSADIFYVEDVALEEGLERLLEL